MAYSKCRGPIRTLLWPVPGDTIAGQAGRGAGGRLGKRRSVDKLGSWVGNGAEMGRRQSGPRLCDRDEEPTSRHLPLRVGSSPGASSKMRFKSRFIAGVMEERLESEWWDGRISVINRRPFRSAGKKRVCKGKKRARRARSRVAGTRQSKTHWEGIIGPPGLWIDGRCQHHRAFP